MSAGDRVAPSQLGAAVLAVVAALAALAALAASMAGCIPHARVPMASRDHPARAQARSECLIAFLPGYGDTKDSFVEHGFIDDLRDAGVEADAITMDANIRYYTKETVVDRLEADLVAPARRRGYKRIFLVGVSMGGLGTVAYAHKHPGEIQGMMLIAPFVGPNDLARRIVTAGGLRRWRPRGPAKLYNELWVWLKGYLEPIPKRPDLYLAFGRRDPGFVRFRLLTSIVKPTHLFVNGGGHGWATWRPLWVSFLRRHGQTMCAATSS